MDLLIRPEDIELRLACGGGLASRAYAHQPTGIVYEADATQSVEVQDRTAHATLAAALRLCDELLPCEPRSDHLTLCDVFLACSIDDVLERLRTHPDSGFLRVTAHPTRHDQRAPVLNPHTFPTYLRIRLISTYCFLSVSELRMPFGSYLAGRSAEEWRCKAAICLPTLSGRHMSFAVEAYEPTSFNDPKELGTVKPLQISGTSFALPV